MKKRIHGMSNVLLKWHDLTIEIPSQSFIVLLISRNQSCNLATFWNFDIFNGAEIIEVSGQRPNMVS